MILFAWVIGDTVMSDVLEQMVDEAVHKERLRTAWVLLKGGDMTVEAVAQVTKLTVEEVRYLTKMKQ